MTVRQSRVVSHKFRYLPFMVRQAHHERTQLKILALRQACPEFIEGPVLSQSKGSGRTANVEHL